MNSYSVVASIPSYVSIHSEFINSPIYVYKRRLGTDILKNLILSSPKIKTTSMEFFDFSEN